MRMTRWFSVAICMAVILVIAGCTGMRGMSKEPTDYVATVYEGHFKTYYFKEDHPDVVTVKNALSEIVPTLFNYNWQTSPDPEERVLANGLKWGSGSVDYRANQISFQLQSYEFDGIGYQLGKRNEAVMASTEVKATVKFTSGADSWLQLNNLKLGEEYVIAIKVDLLKEDNAWVLHGTYSGPPSKK